MGDRFFMPTDRRYRSPRPPLQIAATDRRDRLFFFAASIFIAAIPIKGV
jgi:hypothetical protein